MANGGGFAEVSTNIVCSRLIESLECPYWPNRTKMASVAARFTAASALTKVQVEKASAEANTPAVTALAKAQKGSCRGK